MSKVGRWGAETSLAAGVFDSSTTVGRARRPHRQFQLLMDVMEVVEVVDEVVDEVDVVWVWLNAAESIRTPYSVLRAYL
jgi:hypothetical protein